MKHVISAKDFLREWVEEVLAGAEKMMSYAAKGARPDGLIPSLAKCTLLFAESSTRTRGSFNESARLLGFDCDNIIGVEATSLAKDESIGDTVRMLGKGNQGADILVMRTKIEGAARFAAEILGETNYNTAVINGGDGRNEHPSQALLDWVTIKKYLGRTEDFTLGIVGDLELSRVAHSDLELARLMGVKRIRLVSALEVRAQAKYKRGFEEVKEGESLDLLSDCDVVIVLRVQAERYTDQEKLRKVKSLFRITRKVLDSWKRDVIVLHPLPCIDEIDLAIKGDPRILMYCQAELAKPTRMHLLFQSYNKRTAEYRLPAYQLVRMEATRESSIDQHLSSRRKEPQYFRPIRDGVIIDHIPVGHALKIRQLLNNFEDSAAVIHPIERVPSPTLGRKDVLVLEHYFPSDHFWGAVSFLWPKVSVNFLRDGMHRKMEIGLPEVVVGVFRCPNPYCITNYDPEARMRTRFFIIKDKMVLVECSYCEREFTRDEILNAL